MLDLALLLYSIPRVLLAPNPELVTLLERLTRKPTRLMRRGIETDVFSPARRDVSDRLFRLGYVGRLSPEKNVRILADIEQVLITRGVHDFRFVVVGNGSERAWLERHMQHAEFMGVLHGSELARTYANMDAFLFPSATDTFGLVVLEALASGVPTIVTPFGGPKAIIEPGVSGFIAATAAEFADALLPMMTDPLRHQALRNAARVRALQSSWDRTFETVYDAYADAIGDPARHGLEAAARA